MSFGLPSKSALSTFEVGFVETTTLNTNHGGGGVVIYKRLILCYQTRVLNLGELGWRYCGCGG